MASDFYAAIAAIERATGRRVGAMHPSEEPVRFVPAVSLAFAARDVEPVDADGHEWTTHFAGLAGGDGALPPYLAEEIAQEDPDRPVRRALLTPFHHRATALLFRSVHRCRVPDETRSLADAWPRRLVGLVRGEVSNPVDAEIALALGALLHGPPSAASLDRALRVIARRWLGGAPIRLVERTGARVAIDASARSRLGGTRLGDTALLGGSVEDPSASASVRVGPVDPAHAHALDAGGTARRALALVLRWLASTAVDVRVVVLQPDVPLRVGAARLGRSALGTHAPRLRERRLDPDATPPRSPRQGLSKDGTTRPPKELACDPIPARSSNA